jgi:hypothetical protein
VRPSLPRALNEPQDISPNAMLDIQNPSENPLTKNHRRSAHHRVSTRREGHGHGGPSTEPSVLSIQTTLYRTAYAPSGFIKVLLARLSEV